MTTAPGGDRRRPADLPPVPRRRLRRRGKGHRARLAALAGGLDLRTPAGRPLPY
ncbi:hypothetical protein [Sphaerisporangium rufum]|uniref:hypothetical protein n=1 Tax=Sphaerisporangium rufum TaxID=1381558 RepID=UPI0019508967|nr:hypothetical protein [Sphaerisporangium rufum]